MRPRFGLLAVVLLGCSSRRVEDSPDASARPATHAFSARAEAALAAIDRVSAVRPRNTAAVAAPLLSTQLPARATGAVHVARADRAGVFVDVTTDLRDVPAESASGVTVYPAAAEETDVVQLVEPHRVEELRVLHGPRAASRFSWTLRPGPSVTELRLRAGRVEALEGTDVRLVSTPIVAFDAKDERRAAEITLTKIDGGYRLDAKLDTEGLAYPIVLDPGWTVTFNVLSQIRERFDALVLNDGRVAVLPGWLSPRADVDIYDPLTDKFTVGKPVTSIRADAGAVRLGSSNKIVIFGGAYSGTPSTYEIWDPVGGSSATKTLPFDMNHPAFTVLPTGKVFAYQQPQKAAIYDPAADAWTATALNPVSHGGPSVVTLASGKVLVTGGCCSQALADIYDPTTDTWTNVTNMNGARAGHSMFLLPSGKVLLVGGDTVGGRGEIFDESTKTWTKITDMPLAPGAFGAAKLPDGRVLVTNAGSGKSTMIYEEGKGWSTGTDLVVRRDSTQVVALPSGRALAVAGTGGTIGTTDGRLTAELWTDAAKTCTSPGDCASGFCVDGYCCDRACGEQCFACDVPGREGFCMPVSGAPPHGPRTSCAPYLNCYDGKCTSGCTTVSDCTSGNACIYGTCAVKLAKGAGCVDGTDCSTGNCVDGKCCDTTCTEQCKACDVPGSVGTCTNVTGAPHGSRTSCTPYTCGSGACLAGCTTDAECVTGNYCDATGKCVPAQNNGKACTTNAQCTSGFCVDGYCCNTACTGACQTCSKTPGTCSNVTAGTADPRGICVGECVNGCGASGCTYKASTTVCGVSCIGSTLTNGGRCAGTTEACTGSVSAPCAGGFVCADGKTCKTSCTTGADCVSTVCDVTTGTCGAAPVDAGAETSSDVGIDDASVDSTMDSAADASDDTLVADTFVPETSVDALPIAETAAPSPDPKSSLPATVQTCAKDGDCASGFCVEGVCCDSRCDQPCHSCALLSSPGKCTEEPVGVDLKQNCGPAFTCLGTCGPGGECIGAGKGTMCARNRCTGPSGGIGPAFCSAPGASCDENEGVPFDCSPYTCAPAFGACLTACSTSADCADGFVCDVGSRTCVVPAVADDSGGCAVGEPGRTRALPALALALALLGARRRRR